MELGVVVRFIDESDFINKRKGFIVKDNPDWEIDSSISLDFADISDFEEELKSAICDSVGEISDSSATSDDSDVSDYGEGTLATEKKKVKERNLQRKINREPLRKWSLHSTIKQPTVISSQAYYHSAATSMRYCQNKANKKANRGGNKNWKKHRC